MNIKGGGKGGRNFNDRELSASVRSLALSEIKAILEDPVMTEFKKQILLRLSTSILPRLNEHTGEDGRPMIISFDKTFNADTK